MIKNSKKIEIPQDIGLKINADFYSNNNFVVKLDGCTVMIFKNEGKNKDVYIMHYGDPQMKDLINVKENEIKKEYLDENRKDAIELKKIEDIDVLIGTAKDVKDKILKELSGKKISFYMTAPIESFANIRSNDEIKKLGSSESKKLFKEKIENLNKLKKILNLEGNFCNNKEYAFFEGYKFETGFIENSDFKDFVVMNENKINKNNKEFDLIQDKIKLEKVLNNEEKFNIYKGLELKKNLDNKEELYVSGKKEDIHQSTEEFIKQKNKDNKVLSFFNLFSSKKDNQKNL